MDLSLFNQDLEVVQADVEGNYDLKLEEDSRNSLIKRALTTPLGYLGRYILTETGAINIDTSFGNGLYNKLSEPFTLNWIAEANQDIRTALSQLSPLIEVVDVALYSDGNTISIQLTYSDSAGINTLAVPLSP